MPPPGLYRHGLVIPQSFFQGILRIPAHELGVYKHSIQNHQIRHKNNILYKSDRITQVLIILVKVLVPWDETEPLLRRMKWPGPHLKQPHPGRQLRQLRSGSPSVESQGSHAAGHSWSDKNIVEMTLLARQNHHLPDYINDSLYDFAKDYVLCVLREATQPRSHQHF